ncbi:xanthine dehydrogenase family protein [Breoghania sp.]|uniref:xanthine dehydrogenase family protein molybdopterin-binding subunit n=1 Tax=Breoghania sp. TaxID=2065378 RepID=UPI00320499A8
MFGDDAAPADALAVKVIRSPHHRAAFEFGDLESYKCANGLDLVLSAADVPGENCFGVIPGFEDQPMFADGEARFKGEAVAAIVGPVDIVKALDLSAFPVTFTPLKAALVPDEATEIEDLHESRADNVMCRGFVKHGDPDAAMPGAAVIVEGHFSTGFVEHGYIEPEAGYAVRRGDRLEFHCCTQTPFMNRVGLSEFLGLSPDAIRVVPTAVGGGFGSKLDLTAQSYAALAAWLMNRPVRITYSRTESISSSTKRRPSDITMKIGAAADGSIVAVDFDGTFNTGAAYASWGATVANCVPIHAFGPYCTPNYVARSVGMHTNTPPAGAFRRFGVPQSTLAQEPLYDDLARAFGMDRLEFCRKNAFRNGAIRP